MFLVFDAIAAAAIIIGLALFWDSRLGRLLLAPFMLLAGMLTLLLSFLMVAPFVVIGWVLDMNRKIEGRHQQRQQQRERERTLALERWRERGRSFAHWRER